MENFIISADKTKLDLSVIHDYLSQDSYWAKGIPLHIVERAIDNSLCFGVYEADKQVGFARVITDCATFAYLADVFILPEYRGKGLSKQLVQYIKSYPDLQGLRRWMLATVDAHGLYEQYGFKVISTPERFMEIKNPNIYLN
ncbi:GNAT family N-acetyltransferase [Rubrolithibacter danxiaensis]|uniref:GNAT family N-acetyltransferase n=1 Tax=Rubrolithibacter danxiaensis TaxID=3390805 RepID=UPI003BF85D9C